MREAPPSAVKNKKRATRGSPQGVTRRSKRHAATPQGPVDSAARRDNQQSNGGQDLAGGISPPAGRLLRACKPAPAASDPWEDLTRRRMAGAVIYELKDERGYGVSLQDVADALGLPNRESIQFYRTHEKLSKLMANEPYKKACIDFYEQRVADRGKTDGDDCQGQVRDAQRTR